jgi:hypothetical protein
MTKTDENKWAAANIGLAKALAFIGNPNEKFFL